MFRGDAAEEPESHIRGLQRRVDWTGLVVQSRRNRVFVACDGHGDAAGGESCVQHVGDSVSSQLDDERGVKELEGNRPRVGMWEASGDRFCITEAKVSQLDANKLAEGMGRILEVIYPIIALERILSDGQGLVPPP